MIGSIDIATFIKNLAPNTWVAYGIGSSLDFESKVKPDVLKNPAFDLFANHFYPFNIAPSEAAKQIDRDAAYVTSYAKVYMAA